MSLLKLHHCRQFCTIKISNFSEFNSENVSSFLAMPTYKSKLPFSSSLNSKCKNVLWVCAANTSVSNQKEEEDFELEYLAPDGEVYQKTLRLVECAMFAAVSGLTYILSNSLSVENYFGCFFALPIVFSSMRWGISAARKTMVATFVLLFVLSGPVKALTYLLMHGLLGFAMGSFWRLRTNWAISIFFCSIVRAMGSVGYVLLSSFLIDENILSLVILISFSLLLFDTLCFHWSTHAFSFIKFHFLLLDPCKYSCFSIIFVHDSWTSTYSFNEHNIWHFWLCSKLDSWFQCFFMLLLFPTRPCSHIPLSSVVSFCSVVLALYSCYIFFMRSSSSNMA
ncbi:hypothetical protein M9H77_09699 [Catharanthus roseus]|uniref:Uncharacterized protein n=1 Tax=Catharanthus roseus TaxID=4058 RepID=A0ACC0C1P9_CATRO|nr:hypothetical protein M9H77_09699 [Catharanthus roseus]